MGEKALSAVGATTVFVYFILCFIQGLTNGFAIILGHCAGRHDEKQAKYNIAASVYISIAVAFVITVITCLLVPSVVKWMKVPQDISHDAQVYPTPARRLHLPSRVKDGDELLKNERNEYRKK